MNRDNAAEARSSISAGDETIRRAVADFQAGIDRQKSFQLIVERYYAPVKAFFAKRVFSTEDCIDLTQDTFLSLYKGLDEFRGEARFSTWLFKIANSNRRKWIERQVRSGSSRASPGSPPGAVEDHQPIAVTRENQLSDLLHVERVRELRSAIDELPDQMRKCVMLRVYQDRSYKDIAAYMEVSIETVKAHLFQARKKLGGRLKSVFEDLDF